MTGKTRLLVIAVTVIAVAACSAVWVHGLSKKKVSLTDQQAREILDRELPLGTSRSKVKEFLEHKGWSHSDEGSKTYALVRDASHTFIVRTDIQIRFLFDSEEKLVSYEIKDLFTGP